MKRGPSLCDVPARPTLSTNPRGSRSNDDSIDTRVRCARISRMSGRCCKRGDCVWRGAAWLIQRHARCRKYCSDVILINRGRSAQRDGEVGAGVVEIRSGCGRRTGGRVIFLCGDECVHTHTHTHTLLSPLHIGTAICLSYPFDTVQSIRPLFAPLRLKISTLDGCRPKCLQWRPLPFLLSSSLPD